MQPPQPAQRDLIFISYATEDMIFAKWLARKLAYYGYGVWFDQIKLLGGESWVKDIDVAIKDRSFRVLALLSQASANKENPRKERTLAQQIGKERNVEDFLITLNLDGTRPDWTMSDISWISFRDSWAHGLCRLLKKLGAIDAPQIHQGNPGIARAELNRGEDLVSEEPEAVVTNWLAFEGIPETLRIYDAPGLDRHKLWPWPCFIIGDGKVAALAPPPVELADLVHLSQESYRWHSFDEIRHSSTHAIVVQILNKTVGKWLRSAGCVYSKDTKVTHIPDPFQEDSVYRYVDADDTKRRINPSGKITIKKPAAPPEKVIHHPGIRYHCRRSDVGSYLVELTPALALFDQKHQPIEGKKIGPRRKKVTRGWYNSHWRKRLMVFVQLLEEESSKDENTPFSISGAIKLTCDHSLIEKSLQPDEPDTGDEQIEQIIEVGIDEMEDWRE